ncbi:hemerythrin family protein [Massilia agilis]|uniref:Hemerythrin family protein n=1 Tax=Massilia agilis TaxID=1811226 RepID=A0ABT2D624_9BURK|nr:hemerythrin family protein [Massilia agilis]MCS0806730.1 hemerythrin family protein [Massilia agilis]
MDLPASPTNARPLAAAISAGRRAVAQRMNALACATDEQAAECFVNLVAALEQSFRVEEQVMEATNCRALRQHREAHARVLCALHQAASRIESGDAVLAREAVVLLARFLRMHRPAIDQALLAAPRSTIPRTATRACCASRGRTRPLQRVI